MSARTYIHPHPFSTFESVLFCIKAPAVAFRTSYPSTGIPFKITSFELQALLADEQSTKTFSFNKASPPPRRRPQPVSADDWVVIPSRLAPLSRVFMRPVCTPSPRLQRLRNAESQSLFFFLIALV